MSNNYNYIAGTIICIMILFENCRDLPQKHTFDELMKAPTAALNKTSGEMIDKETRFDSSVVLQNRTWEFYYTFVNYDQSQLIVEDLKDSVEPILRAEVIDGRGFIILRDNQATIKFCYRDKNQHTLFTITFKIKDYRNVLVPRNKSIYRLIIFEQFYRR